MIFVDERFASPRIHLGRPNDANMRIPDDFLKSVCFLCVQDKGKWKFGGTAFFVAVPVEGDPTHSYIYLVTAKHCIDKAAPFGLLYLRINKHDGSADFVQINIPWVFLPDSTADVAAIAWAPDPTKYSYKHVPLSVLVTPEIIQVEGVGPGDDLVTIGLFTKHSGRTANIPIVRSGAIAAMPGEPLQDEDGGEYAAYLAEIRSLGGLSGSPVFVLIGPARIADKMIHLRFRILLLGLVRGHWDVKRQSSDFIGDLDHVNMGMALITPAEYIIQLLNCQEFREMRRRDAEKERRNAAPTLDSEFGNSDQDHFTKEDFEAALRKVSKRPEASQSDEGKSET